MAGGAVKSILIDCFIKRIFLNFVKGGYERREKMREEGIEREKRESEKRENRKMREKRGMS